MNTHNQLRRCLPIALIPLLAWVLFPFFVMVTTALKDSGDATSWERWLPSTWHFTNFVLIWKEIPLARYLMNSVVIASGATALAISIGFPAAYAFARLKFTGRSTILFGLLATQMFSPIVVIVGLTKTMVALSLEGTYWGLIFVYAAANLAFAVWLLMGYLVTIPSELDEAAVLDGCSPLRTVTGILFPLARPGVITATIFVFIASWNEFVLALAFTGGNPSIRPLSVGIFDFYQQYEILWPYIMAAAIVATIPVILLFLSVERHLVRGLTTGALK